MFFTCLLALLVTRGLSSIMPSFTADTASATTCSGSDVVFEQPVRSVIQCASMCSINQGCDGYFYTDANGACVGCRTQCTSGTAMSSPDEGTVFFRKDDAQWKYFEGSHYKVINVLQTYPEAKAFCQGICGYPAHVNSQAEHDFLEQMMDKNATYIGLELSQSTNEWFWGDDESRLTFDVWGENQPNGDGSKRCVVMAIGYDWKWTDCSCSVRRKVVCERK